MVLQLLRYLEGKYGKEGVNLRDPRYGFRHFAVQCAREFARRAMVAGIVKNHRTHAIDKMRSVAITLFVVFMTPTKHKILTV